MKLYYKQGGNLIVWRLGKTTNKKIAPADKKVLQTYTFSLKQWELVHSGEEFSMADFFALDWTNCLDCLFSGNQGKGGCYTHKFGQYRGFKSMLRSITDIPSYKPEMFDQIVEMAEGNYVRFGTYGEPSLLGEHLVAKVSEVSSSWTGYTHQHDKEWAKPYAKYFMASVHSAKESHEKLTEGWRSFAAITEKIPASGLVGCPASNEGGFKSNCAACGLCSGTEGKGKKSVEILIH